jgi:hypothetical protein
MYQVDIEDLGESINARQARRATKQGAQWFVQRVGLDGYWVGCPGEGGRGTAWVRPVNGSGQPKTFRTLDAASSWLRVHAGAKRFEVLEAG